MNYYKLDSITLRNNQHVSMQDNKYGTIPRDHFYKTRRQLQGNYCVLQKSGNVLFRNLSMIVPETLLQLAESISKKFKIHVANITDIRGTHVTIKWGSYIERGSSGAIWTKKNLPGFEGFLEAIDPIGKFVSSIFSLFFPDITHNLQKMPEDYNLWNSLSLLFWNATNVSKDHIDIRDYDWSIVIPFGDFTGGEVDLKYINTTVNVKRGDLYFIRSREVFHNVLENVDREAFVFTNHKAVIKRFCNSIK